MKAMKLSGFAMGVSLLSAAAPTTAYADVVTFNFEGLAVQSGLTSLTLTAGGLTATLTRPGSSFGIFDLSGFGASPSFGARSLDPFDQDQATSNTAFILNFSQAITGLSIDMGDFGQDTDALTLQLYSGLNGSGSLLGSSSATLPAIGNTFTFLTPSLSTSSALSARFIGGSTAFPNSVYYDNITVTFTPVATTAPEPGTLVLFASGIAGLGFIRRKKRL